MQDDPTIYINSATPGYTQAQLYPDGDPFDVIFDHSADETGQKPMITCAESHARDLRSRHSQLVIDGVTYRVIGDVYRDGMGLATVTLQEE